MITAWNFAKENTPILFTFGMGCHRFNYEETSPFDRERTAEEKDSETVSRESR